MKRAVITGLGMVSPLGCDVESTLSALETGESAVRRMEGWERYIGLQSLVAAPAELRGEKKIPRQKRRSMGRMSIFAVQAAEQAVADSGISPGEDDAGRTGCIVGSTMGSSQSMNEAFESMLPERDLSNMTSMSFFQCVSHTAAMNVSNYFGITGIVMATSAACASGLQAIGAAYDLVRCGKQDAVICGGAEDLHPTVTGSFDVLFATSTHYNESPGRTPRPFDKERDGLVCGEGSGVIVVEDYERARARGAKIYAEITGYHTCGSGVHVSQSDSSTMVRCMKSAMDQAGILPSDVDYISAHATGTTHGDAEEARAIRDLFGNTTPASSLKGQIGHTLGASGAIELIASLKMAEKGELLPTFNLENVDPECAGINHLQEKKAEPVRILLKNSFAFGGINAVLVCRRL